MSDDKFTEEDPERTLVTLDQLSQTIEVMTSVVNRLRRHLSEQIKAQLENQTAQSEAQQLAEKRELIAAKNLLNPDKSNKRESFVVEINQQGAMPRSKTTKILH